MPNPPTPAPQVVGLEFKARRVSLFANRQHYPLQVNDPVIVEAERGEDLGWIRKLDPAICPKKVDSLAEVLRKASAGDMERVSANRRREDTAARSCQQKADARKLDMRVVDAEVQFDHNKFTFFFLADNRVDFRQLVRDLAGEHRMRIELRQIGARDFARREGGCGACGLERCCTTLFEKFAPITTQMAKEQNLPLNPTKLAGVCGKLKCCLMYERQMYKDMVAQFPPVHTVLPTDRGKARVERLDIFRELVHVRFEDDSRDTLTLAELTPAAQPAQ